ncbi:VOC family protein [Algirhabdus cladophorae]|uniref:VOC family protein n=1 Tax=Algirhabdus cladophorae TaxID=3377108 RepID=UPI003B8484D6
MTEDQMPYTHGNVHWSELATHDVDAALEYYKSVCGWDIQTEEMPEGPYHMGLVAGVPVVGIFDIKQMEGMQNLPSHWMTYLAVDDVDAAVQTTADTGGQVMKSGFDVPQVGRIAIVADPSGAVIGLIQPAD